MRWQPHKPVHCQTVLSAECPGHAHPAAGRVWRAYPARLPAQRMLRPRDRALTGRRMCCTCSPRGARGLPAAAPTARRRCHAHASRRMGCAGRPASPSRASIARCGCALPYTLIWVPTGVVEPARRRSCRAGVACGGCRGRARSAAAAVPACGCSGGAAGRVPDRRRHLLRPPCRIVPSPHGHTQESHSPPRAHPHL